VEQTDVGPFQTPLYKGNNILASLLLNVIMKIALTSFVFIIKALSCACADRTLIVLVTQSGGGRLRDESKERKQPHIRTHDFGVEADRVLIYRLLSDNITIHNMLLEVELAYFEEIK